MHHGVGKAPADYDPLKKTSVDLVHSIYWGVTLCSHKNPLSLNAFVIFASASCASVRLRRRPSPVSM